MSRSTTRFDTSRGAVRGAIGLTALTLLLPACGSDGGDDTQDRAADPDAEVTITTMYLPPTDQASLREAYLERVERFEAKYPNINVEPQETKFEADVFQALIAGGTVPTVMHVPFTEPQGLIARDQAQDITEEFGQFETFELLNEELVANATDAEGRIYGIPIESYDLGLAYNRDLFEQAGLDPDDPPSTWNEVRTAAKAITDSTGQAGYAQMTTDNTGGWIYTTLLYAFGGTVEEPDGDGYRASFNSEEGRQALDYLRTLRWEDNSMGADFLLNFAKIRETFAAGKIGMYIEAPFGITTLVQNYGFDPAHYGFTSLPQEGAVHGTLTGGAMAMIAPNATPEQRLAGLKWIEMGYLERYFDRDVAREVMQARVDDDQTVGVPQLHPVNAEQTAEFESYYADLVNIPLENFEPYTSAMGTLPLIPEPPERAQEVYSILDSMVQGALTREDADTAQLLSDAESQVNNLLARQ